MISMRSLVRYGTSAKGRASCGSPEPRSRKHPGGLGSAAPPSRTPVGTHHALSSSPDPRNRLAVQHQGRAPMASFPPAIGRLQNCPVYDHFGDSTTLQIKRSGEFQAEDFAMPNTKNGTVREPAPHLRVIGEQATPPPRRRNSEVRPREYLTPAEAETLRKTAKQRGRYGHRDSTMILLAYRHGLRVSELVALRWDQIDFAQGRLHVNRAKNGLASVHPLGSEEIRAL